MSVVIKKENIEKVQRKRCKNYTEAEKDELLGIVKTYIGIIENKQTDAVWANEKRQAWEEISESYNKKSTSGLRTGIQLKLLYDGMKKTAKKNKSNDKARFENISDIIDLQDPIFANAELLPHEEDLAAVRGLTANGQNTIAYNPVVIETQEEILIDSRVSFNKNNDNKSWKPKLKKKNQNYVQNDSYRNEILKMKQAKQEKQMAILDVMQKKEQAELDMKLLQLENLKKDSQ